MTAPFVESHQPNRPNLAAGLGLNSSSTYGVSEATRKAIEQLGYQINVGQGPIGDGGSAYVFAATHPELEGTVAIKIAKDNDPVRIAQFDRERKVLASNSQINDIVPQYYPGTGPSNCQPFIIMERIRGDKILDYAKNHQLDVERKIDLIQRLFQAVHQLHLNNLTHGDPSPNNVLVQAGDRIRLLDLGASKRISKGYHSVHSIDGPSGTPGYAPDSQLSGTDRASVQTDLHACASIAYELLTSENRNASTQSKSLPSTSVQRRESESVFLSKLASNQVPHKVATIIARAMRTKDPTKVDGTDSRLFHSANEVVQAIEAWRLGRVRTRNRIRSGVASLLLMFPLVLVSVWGYGQFLEVQRTQRRQSISTLQQEIGKITNGSHPAVKQRLLTVDQNLATFHSAESTGSDSNSDEAQRLLVESMRELLLVSRKLERVIPLREALGIVLEKMPWVEAAPSIAGSKNELAQRYLKIGELIDAGETDQVDGILTSLQADLAELANRNIAAESALQARTQFDSDRDSLSERILKLDGFAPVNAIGGSAETAWKSGDFQQATTLFGQARQKLAQVLPSLESTDETKERVDKQTIRLKDEVSKLRSQITTVTQERDEKIVKTNDLQSQIATITKQSADDRDARTRYENQTAQIAQENTKLKKELASVKTTLEAEGPLAAAYREMKPKYEAAERERDSLAKKLEPLQSKVTILESAAKSASGVSDIVSKANDINRLQQEIDALDKKDGEAAFAVLSKALKSLDATTQERTVQLTQYKETSPTIKAIDTRIAEQRKIVEDALNAYDQSQNEVYEKVDLQFNTLKAERTRLMDVEGLLDTSTRIKQIDAQGRELVQQKSKYIDSHTRIGNAVLDVDVVKIASDLVANDTRTKQEITKQQAALSLTSLKAGDAAEFTIAGVPTRFRYCPPCKKGEFKMGSPTNEEGHQSDETQVDVWFDRGFFVLETEANNELWNAVMNEKKGDAGKSKFPVVDVTHNACSDFVDRANKTLLKKSGPEGVYKLVLPTEAQWEYACRAGSTSRFCFGDGEAELGDYAWYDKNSGNQLHAVGTTKTANRWNIRDMHGSVWEWTADWYDTKLMGGLNPTGPKTGTIRVYRGGSYCYTSVICRSARRRNFSPDYHRDNVGFRPALQFSQD